MKKMTADEGVQLVGDIQKRFHGMKFTDVMTAISMLASDAMQHLSDDEFILARDLMVEIISNGRPEPTLLATNLKRYH